jgi:hypothetical protein
MTPPPSRPNELHARKCLIISWQAIGDPSASNIQAQKQLLPNQASRVDWLIRKIRVEAHENRNGNGHEQ